MVSSLRMVGQATQGFRFSISWSLLLCLAVMRNDSQNHNCSLVHSNSVTLLDERPNAEDFVLYAKFTYADTGWLLL